MPPAWIQRLPDRPVTRFAPSPTGRLHLGHVVNAVWVFGIAQARSGRVVLRMEDHDRGRSRPDYEAAILDDLAWLGLAPDSESLESLAAGGGSPYRQSDNDPRYQAAVGRLEAHGAVLYWCDCSRRTVVRSLGEDAPAAGEEPRYPGTCRDKGLAPGAGRGLRVVLPSEDIAFDDLRLGALVHTPAEQCGDLLLRDATGNWTYQFSVVVDDLEHGIDLIVRGEDLLGSTGRQILLRQMLGRADRPAVLHHPLLLDDAGAKLSKRDGASGIAELRAAGLSPEAVLGQAAHRSGLIPTPLPIGPGELGSLFR